MSGDSWCRFFSRRLFRKDTSLRPSTAVTVVLTELSVAMPEGSVAGQALIARDLSVASLTQWSQQGRNPFEKSVSLFRATGLCWW